MTKQRELIVKRTVYLYKRDEIQEQLDKVRECSNLSDTIMSSVHTVRIEHYTELIELIGILID